jgi:hypothetical protein
MVPLTDPIPRSVFVKRNPLVSELQLSVPTINLLIALVHLRGTGTTHDFEALYGADSVGKSERDELAKHDLAKRRKVGRSFTYELTDAGWLETRRLLRGPRPEKASVRTARVLWAFVGDLSKHMDRAGIELADVYPVEPETEAGTDTAEAIREAYTALAAEGGSEWVPLRRLREHLNGIDRDELDKELTELLGAHAVRLIPESNQKTLTEADREAALWIGGQYRHLIAIEAG